MFSFLKSKFDKRKPSTLLKQLYTDLNPTASPKPLSKNNSASLSESSVEVADESISKRYTELEEFLSAAASGTTFHSKPVNPEETERCIAIAIEQDILFTIALRINDIGKELRRVVSNVWNLLLKLQHPKTKQFTMVDYLTSHTGCIGTLFAAYGATSDSTINIGVMLRDSLKSPAIEQYVFQHGLIYQLFTVIESSNFDISADAFQTLREALTNQKDLGSKWLRDNYDCFFSRYSKLLDASSEDSYVTVRQGLNLLSSIILDRGFMKLMLRCVEDETLLKNVLMLLSHKSRVIELEAFHVLKVFVANPNKKPKIAKILSKNSARIIKLLDRIEEGRPDDKEFLLDKRAVVAKLEVVPDSASEGDGPLSRPDSAVPSLIPPSSSIN